MAEEESNFVQTESYRSDFFDITQYDLLTASGTGAFHFSAVLV